MKSEKEQRGTFRVTVKRDSGIDAWLHLGGKKWPAEVGDISAEGVFIKLSRGPIAALKVDGKIDVELTFDGEKLVLHGLIRSEHEGGYGIFFPTRDRAGQPNPLDRFAKISAQLQRTDLSQRLKVLRLPE